MHATNAEVVCQRARELAALVPGGQAYACVTVDSDLPADPLQLFADHADCDRFLIWNDSEYMLAVGRCHAVAASGPGRTYHLAEVASSCATLLVHDGRPPTFLIQLGFEDRAPGPSHWGHHLAGAGFTLPRRLFHWRRDGTSSVTHCLNIAAQATGPLAERLIEDDVPRLGKVATAAWPSLTDTPYTQLVDDAIGLLEHGGLRKVVLARAVDHSTSNDLVGPLHHLRQHADERTFVYAVDLDDGSTFIGATPELLFQSRGCQLTALSLAGSRPRGSDTDSDGALADELFASTKERKEHQLVVEHLVRHLRPRASKMDIPQTPHIRRLARLQHLETVIDCQLNQADPFDVVAALQPTPAVAGLPTEGAIDYIRRHEGLHRGLYTGCIGTLCGDEARLVVPLRGGIIGSNRARLFAGAGIVETSDPSAEMAETELKLRPMRQALGLE